MKKNFQKKKKKPTRKKERKGRESKGRRKKEAAVLRKEYHGAGLGESPDGGREVLAPASSQGSGRQGAQTHRGSRAGTPPAALRRSPA